MNISFLGIGFDAIMMLKMFEPHIPAHYLAISSDAIDLEGYAGDKILFRMRPSVDAAASRILPKIKKQTKDAEVVFLLSEVSRQKENIICNIAEGLENKTVISIVWYPRKNHGQRGISKILDRLGEQSAVVAIPQGSFPKLLNLVAEYTELILFMYQQSYAYAQPDTGKRVISKGGLLHLAQDDFETEFLNLEAEGLPWSLSAICYNPSLDTGMYGPSALLHLTVPQGTDPAIVQYIIEYVYSHIGEDWELNFSITEIPEAIDSVGVKVLVTDTITAKEADPWF